MISFAQVVYGLGLLIDQTLNFFSCHDSPHMISGKPAQIVNSAARPIASMMNDLIFIAISKKKPGG